MNIRMLAPQRAIFAYWKSIAARWRLVLAGFVLFSAIHRLEAKKNVFTHHAHTITPLTISFTTSLTPIEPLAPALANSFCRTHNFAPYLPRRKIYDLFLLNTELDWLEVRLETLYNSVDYFVIVESAFTFTSLPKPLLLTNNWSRFEKYHAKIIHHVVKDLPKNAKSTWDVEIYQRNAMFSQVFPKLEEAKASQKGDVIVVSDVDEIPRPATMVVLRNCEIPKHVTLRSQFYYYSFQWLHHGVQWAHGQATIFGGLEPGQTVLPHNLRAVNKSWNVFGVWWEATNIWNAGWHCSTCFETIEEVLEKMGSFSHTELNKKEFRDKKGIVDRIRHGKDLWDRWGESYDRVEANEDVPEYLLGNITRWEYMLNRDGENAGFIDVK